MRATLPLLAPRPKRVVRRRGQWRARGGVIVVPASEDGRLMICARRVRAMLREHVGAAWRIVRAGVASGETPDATGETPDAMGESANGKPAAVRIVLEGGAARGAQGYRLRIGPERIVIAAGAAAGIWNGVMTLGQWLAGCGGRPACVEIDDWPDFERRGVLLDISRCKVPTMRTLRGLVAFLAGLKINELQLYMEHTFAYRAHRRVWRGCSPLTAREVRELDRFCRERFIELVPCQNTLGHMERWLRHPEYAPLAEATGPYATPWGEVRTTRTTLCPSDRRSLALVRSLLEELLPNFTSRRVNIGCDEPFELGQGRSRALCERYGLGMVYVEYVRLLCGLLREGGRTAMIWGDVLASHPETLEHVPGDATILEWGYEAGHPFARRCAAYRKAGLEFYVCPGTSSWCSFAGRTRNALANLRAAASAGRRLGARGYLITDWGDSGHRQYLPVSFGPLVYGAGMAWGVRENRALDVARATSALAFGDATGRAARAWLELGDVHRAGGVRLKNQTTLFRCIQARLDDPRGVKGLTIRAVGRMESRLNAIARRVRRGWFGGPDGRLCADELEATIAVMRHACRRARAMLALHGQGRSGGGGGRVDAMCREVPRLAAEMRQIVARHRRLWLARNRPGGLRESAGYYERKLLEYETWGRMGGGTVSGRGRRVGRTSRGRRTARRGFRARGGRAGRS